MITFTWVFSQFDTAPSLDGLTDVVKIIHWRLNAEEDGIAVSAYGTANLADPSSEQFVPFQDITEQMAIDWVSSVINVSDVQGSLANQIAAIKNPPVVPMPPPFSSAGE